MNTVCCYVKRDVLPRVERFMKNHSQLFLNIIRYTKISESFATCI